MLEFHFPPQTYDCQMLINFHHLHPSSILHYPWPSKNHRRLCLSQFIVLRYCHLFLKACTIEFAKGIFNKQLQNVLSDGILWHLMMIYDSAYQKTLGPTYGWNPHWLDGSHPGSLGFPAKYVPEPHSVVLRLPVENPPKRRARILWFMICYRSPTLSWQFFLDVCSNASLQRNLNKIK